MPSAQIITRFTRTGNRNDLPLFAILALANVAFTDISGQPDSTIANNDLVVIEVEGLTTGQLNSLNARPDVIPLTSKPDDNNGYTDTPMNNGQIVSLTNRIRNEFGIAQATINQYINADDPTMTTLKLVGSIKKLCKERKGGLESVQQEVNVKTNGK